MELNLNSASIAIFTFIFLLVLILKRGKQYSAKLPPSPWKLPIFGHIHHMLGAGGPHRGLRKLSLEYGPLFYLKLGQVEHVIVSSPEVAEEITKHHDLNFASRPQLRSAAIMTYDYKDIAFAPYGSYWRQVRKLCALELLNTRRVKAYATLRDEEIAELVSYIGSTVGMPINFTERVTEFTNVMTSRAAFGTKCKHGTRFMAATKKSIEAASGFSLADLFPDIGFLYILTGMSARVKQAHDNVDAILDEILMEHEVKRSSNTSSDHRHEEQDIVDVLLEMKDKPDREFPFTNANIKAVILDLFSAGTDTSSSTIVWAMTELMKNPGMMKKAQAEVRGALKGKEKIQVDDIDAIRYLKLVVKETLRLHPPLPLLLPRVCNKTCQVGGYEIPEGIRIIINAWAIGHDTRFWEDAETFRPERFEGSSVDYKGNNYEFLPFGSGRRMCPGMNFGLANVEVPLAHLLYRFDWELPNGVKPEKLDMNETFGVTISREQDLWLVARSYNV